MWNITTRFHVPDFGCRGIVRAAWQDSRDTSTVWGRVERAKLTFAVEASRLLDAGWMESS